MATSLDSLWRRVAQSRWLDIAAAVLAGIAVARLGFMLPGRATANDFAHYYIAGRLALEGTNPYAESITPLYPRYGLVPDDEVFPVTPPNPPPFIWLFAPIAALPVRAAYGVWQVGQLGCLFAILWLSRRLLGERLSPRGWRFVWAAAFAATPVFWHFCLGQTQLLLAALVLAALVWQKEGRDTAALLAVVTAGLLKIFPFVLVPWFVWRGAGPWRARWGRVGVAVVFGVVVILVTNVSWWVEFFQKQGAVVAENLVDRIFNVTVPSLVTNLGFAAVGFAPSPTMAWLWPRIGMVSGMVLLAGAYAVCWRRSGAREVEFSLLCAAMLAGSPTTWGHYLVFLIFPLTLLATLVKQRAAPGRVVAFGLILALTNNLARGDFLLTDGEFRGQLGVRLVINYAPLAGLLGLAVFLARELWVNSKRDGAHGA